MRKKNFKPMIISALLAVGFGATSVGTSFALFTDNASTAINVTAGKVDIELSATAMHTYSAEYDGVSTGRVDENGYKYQSKATEVEGVFTNGGTAALVDNVLTLTHITPGDRVTFNAALSDSSNVDIKYRLVFEAKAVGTGDKTLASGMRIISDMSGTSATYEGLDKYVSPWTYHAYDANSQLSKSFSFDIELPIDAGNEYQDKAIQYSFQIEAVQGNAYTVDDAGVAYLEKNLVAEATATANQKLVLQTNAGDSASEMYVKTTIPAEAGLATNDKVKLVVSNVSAFNEETTKNGTLNFDVSLYVNDVKRSSFNNQDIDVEVYIGEGYDIKSVSHNGVVITDYTYEDGKITFVTKTFSPFVVSYEKNTNEYGFYESYVQDGHWVHTIKNKSHFRNIMIHIDARKELVVEGYPIADATTEYIVLNDINFGGTLWKKTDPVYTNTFTGTLKGVNESITLSNISSSETVANNIAKNGDPIVVILFNRAIDAHFENIKLASMIINAPTAEYSALFTTGNNTNAGVGHYITFKNCEVLSSCSVRITNGASAFVGLGRHLDTISFENCINRASIKGTTNVGAFIANGTSQSQSSTDVLVSFKNTSNYGEINGTDFVGGFTGNVTNGKITYKVVGGGSYGDIYKTASENNNGFFLGGPDSLKKADISGAEIGGNIYLSISGSSIASSDYTGKSDCLFLGNSNYTYEVEDATTHEDLDTTDKIGKHYKKGLPISTLSFNSNNDYVLEATVPSGVNTADVDKVVVNMQLHCLKMGQDGKEYPTALGGENWYTLSFEYDSFASIDVKRVGQVGYFIPNGYGNPSAVWDADFSRYLLTEGNYQEGYTKRSDGKSYIVIKNDNPGDFYNAICVWRNRVEYSVEAFDSKNNLLARGTTEYGWDYEASGYDSLITAITD